MNEPWFDTGFWGGIAGASVGTVGGLFGALCGVFAPRGVGRTFILGGLILIFATGIAALIAGVIAIIVQQPFFVIYTLILLGGLQTVVFTPLFFVIRNVYVVAELRRMEARDLTAD